MNLKCINDIRVICKHCDLDMVLESNMNNRESIYICKGCDMHIILFSKGCNRSMDSFNKKSDIEEPVDVVVSKVVKQDNVRGLV